jgi:hypothetical protein
MDIRIPHVMDARKASLLRQDLMTSGPDSMGTTATFLRDQLVVTIGPAMVGDVPIPPTTPFEVAHEGGPELHQREEVVMGKGRNGVKTPSDIKSQGR